MTDAPALFDQLLDDDGVDNAVLAAVCDAMSTADSSWLPQTVYLASDASEACWASTNALSGRLELSRSFVTILPSRYFSGFWAY